MTIERSDAASTRLSSTSVCPRHTMTRTAPTHPASTSASTRPIARARPSARRVVRACATAASKVVVVGAVGEGSNAEAAGLRPGDILRATSAVRQQMEMPTWQLLGGGIGRPKTFRFIFGADLDAKPARDFEEVLGAVGSNRLDPQGRPAILVVERPA